MGKPRGNAHEDTGKRDRRGFGRLRKLKSGRVQAGYIGPDCKLYMAPATFASKIDAEGWLAQERRLIDLGVWQPPDTREPDPSITVPTPREKPKQPCPTLREYSQTWLADRSATPQGDAGSLRPSSQKDYQMLLRNHILPALGDMRLDEIDLDDVVAWHRAMAKKKIARTRSKSYSLLRGIMNAAIVDRTLPTVTTNPCRIKGAGTTSREKHITSATLDELARIVVEMPDKWRAAVLLGAWCAMRYGEVFELRRKDVDLDAGIVRVERGVAWVAGEVVIGPPKTKAGKRRVAIPPHIIPDLRRHLTTYVSSGQNALLFPSDDGRNIRPSTFLRAWHRACAKAGREDLKFHHLRHTGAVLAAQSGATLSELMGRLGHATPAMAMIYQHAAADRDREIAKHLSEMARKASAS
ncbi:site-specific integrase [Luteococcus peritonei]|uniref:Tyrosine-type recombinase/integrase n=1 Tax=Luteococcus peritonei TaxID=88874 RepID=A0ABW4RTP8_9ACTN